MAFPDPGVLERVLAAPESAQASDLAHLREAGLCAYVGHRVGEGHPLRLALLAAAEPVRQHHAEARAALRPLLRAWAGGGVPVVPLGGFALSELDYAHPEERVYRDVTLLLPDDPAVVRRAAQLADAQGWQSDGLHQDSRSWTDEVLHLYHQEAGLGLIGVRHLFPLASGLPLRRVQESTARLWSHLDPQDWQGVEVQLPPRADRAVLVALRRTWGWEQGRVQPVDFTDLQVLRGAVAESSTLAACAAQWGGAATWAAFTALCDGGSGRPTLSPAHPAPTLLRAARQDGADGRQGRRRERGRTLARSWRRLPGGLVHVLAAWQAVRAGAEPREVLARWTPPGSARRLPYRRVQAHLDSILLWTGLLFPRQIQQGVCVPRSYASYRALRRQGHPAVFFSGVARVGQPGHAELRSHAWIEDEAGELRGYEIGNRHNFRIMFRYPSKEQKASADDGAIPEAGGQP